MLFEFDEIIYDNKDILGIGDDTYTFDSYEYYVSIMVDKTDLVKEYFLTNVWDELIKQKLSKPDDKVDLI